MGWQPRTPLGRSGLRPVAPERRCWAAGQLFEINGPALSYVPMCAGSNTAPSGCEVRLAQLPVILATASSVVQVALAMNLKLVMAAALPSPSGTIADAVASVTTATSNPCSNRSLK